MIALPVIAAVVIILALGAVVVRISGWKGFRNEAPGRVHHVTDPPGYGLSSYEEGKRVMRLWPAVMREANQAQAPADDGAPVACHNGYCGAWSDES